MTTFFSQWRKDLVNVLFPDICLACNRVPKTADSYFCTNCLTIMPYTDHFELKDNQVTRHFLGRITIKHGAALLYFHKNGLTQHILHQLKYKGKKDVGVVMGELAADKMKSSVLIGDLDIIIPVPIHPKKERIRGYNQSTVFGKSLANGLNLNFRDDVLIKVKNNPSQTGMSRTERIENVTGGFKVNLSEYVSGKKVLLVDDVITTGATLEACCSELLKAGAKEISIVCIAAANSI